MATRALFVYSSAGKRVALLASNGLTKPQNVIQKRVWGNAKFANKAERSFMEKPKGDQKYCRIPICVTKRICKKMKEVLLTRTEILGNSYVKND